MAAVRYQVQAKYFKDKNRDKRILYKQHDKAINDTSSNNTRIIICFVYSTEATIIISTLCDTVV